MIKKYLLMIFVLLLLFPISNANINIEGEIYDFSENIFVNTELIGDKIYLQNDYDNGYTISPVFDLTQNKQLETLITDYSLNFLPYQNTNHPLFNTEKLVLQYEFNELGLSEFKEQSENNYNLEVDGTYNYQDNYINIDDTNKLYTNISNINFNNGLTFVTYFKIKELVDRDYLIELIADDDTRYWCRARDTTKIRCNFDGDLETNSISSYIDEWVVFTGIIDPFTLSYQVYFNEDLILNETISSSMNINLTELYFLSSKDNDETFNADSQNFYVFEDVFNNTQIRNINSIFHDEIQISYRTCNDENCNGESFTILNNMQSLNYKESDLGIFDISSSDVNQYFQYKITYYKNSDNMTYYFENLLVTDNYDYVQPLIEIGGYNKIGGNEQNFRGETTTFNYLEFDYDMKTKAFTNLDYVPLVRDLNNDNINEIIIIDGNTLKLYHYSNLESVDSYTTTLTNPIQITTAKMYNDNSVNIIACDSNQCMIFGLDDDNQIYLIKFHNLGINPTNNKFVFNCNDEYCIYEFIQDSGRQTTLNVLSFDINEMSPVQNLETTGNQFSTYYGKFCNPFIPYMTVRDHDNNGEDNFIFSVILEQTYYVLNSEVNIYSLSVDDNVFPNASSIVTEYFYSESQYKIPFGSGDTCESKNIHHKASSPLVADTDDFLDTKEISFGYQVDNNEFKIYLLDSEFNYEMLFPEFFDADGVLLSNPIQANIFDDSENTDICILGYATSERELDLLCGGSVHSDYLDFKKSDEFFFEIEDFPNLNFTLTEGYPVMIHSVNAIEQINQFNSDEIVTPYGIFETDFENINELELLWEQPINNEMFLFPIDVEGVGLQDLIGLTENQLFYFDDKQTNQPPTISKDNGLEFNPCLTKRVVDFNSSLEVMIKPEDKNNNKVSVKVELYADSSNEQDSGWSPFYNSGTQITFGSDSDVNKDFIFNKITSTGILRVSMRDNFDLTQINFYDFSFSVLNNGSTTFNDGCITTYAEVSEDIRKTENPETVTEDYTPTIVNFNNNTMVNSARQLGGLFGFSELMVIFILMCLSALAPWIIIKGNAVYSFIVMIFLLIIELVGATWLQIMPLGITLTIGLISIGLTIPMLKNFVTGREGS